ncbi:hypothetical protein pb186bvf_005012 [Paramecium bursaria]
MYYNNNKKQQEVHQINTSQSSNTAFFFLNSLDFQTSTTFILLDVLFPFEFMSNYLKQQFLNDLKFLLVTIQQQESICECHKQNKSPVSLFFQTFLIQKNDQLKRINFFWTLILLINKNISSSLPANSIHKVGLEQRHCWQNFYLRQNKEPNQDQVDQLEKQLQSRIFKVNGAPQTVDYYKQIYILENHFKIGLE